MSYEALEMVKQLREIFGHGLACVMTLILITTPAMSQLNHPSSPTADNGKIQIGKLWCGTDGFPYVTNYGFIGYMDYPGGSEDYYVNLFSLILSGNTSTQSEIVTDLGANTTSGSGVQTFQLWNRDVLQENWNMHDSDENAVFMEATASFGGNPWNLQLNTKIRMWALADYDDFVIVQYTFMNTGSDDITDFFVASSMPAECGEKTVENRNLDDVVGYDSQDGLVYMHDDDYDGGLSPYWVGQALMKAPPAGGSSDDAEVTNQFWATLHYFSWDNIPNSKQALYSRIREPLSGDFDTPPGVYDLFSGVGPFTLKVGGDIELTICYVYGKEEGILQNLSSAKSLLNDDFQVPGDKIPPPPPSLSTSVDGVNITISWSGDKSENEPDFAGYRLYKSDLSPVGPWRLLDEDPSPPHRSYVDRAQVGYKNFYAVTAFDQLGNESSIWSIYSKTFEGVEAANPPESSLDRILVVPNPYIGNATWELNDFENKILFTRLPERCTIYVYSLSGDLVDILYHNVNGDLSPDTNPTGDESWDLMTKNDQEVVSGLYIYFVISESGERKTGKFAIIKGEK